MTIMIFLMSLFVTPVILLANFKKAVQNAMMKLILKGIVHPKKKILSLITHPHVVPNP